MSQKGAEMCPLGTGDRARDGSCLDGPALPAQGELTAAQEATLTAMAGEEKLAHDLYVAFAATYDAMIFDRIAAAEAQHLTTVRTLLDRYGLTDPTAGLADGQFSDPTVQATYDRLLAQGQVDLAAALQVGRTVEQADIDDLQAALEGLTAPDVTQAYQNLLRAPGVPAPRRPRAAESSHRLAVPRSAPGRIMPQTPRLGRRRPISEALET